MNRGMSVGKLDSPFHIGFLDNEHYRQQQQLNKNIMDRLAALESRRIPNMTFQSEDLDSTIQSVANVSLENLRRLENSTRANWEEMYEKMRNMENKILRLFRDKQEAMEYLDMRVASIENGQKTVNDIMKKAMAQSNDKYSEFSLLEDRIKQAEHRGELKNQQVSEEIKMVEEQVRLKLKATNSCIESLESKIAEADQIDEKMRVLQMEFKENRRKVISLEDKLSACSALCTGFSDKLADIAKKVQSARAPEVKETAPLRSDPISRQRSEQRPVSHTNGSDDIMRHNFRDLSSINRVNRTSKNQSQEEQDNMPMDSMPSVRGVRGLLQRSKQKEEKNIGKKFPPPPINGFGLPLESALSRKRGLERQLPLQAPTLPRNRGLPPVRAEPRMLNRDLGQPDSEQEEGEMTCGVDEEGYLVDQDGNYIYNEDNERMQLSKEEYEELVGHQY